MIISNLIGGLGNQMFQYAAAYALAMRHETLLRLDISDFVGYELHNGFELDRVFDISGEVASQEDVRAVLRWRANPSLLRMMKRKRLGWLSGRRIAREPHFHYWPGFADLPDNVYLLGYWQSERYFDQVRENLEKEFTFSSLLDERNATVLQEIENCNSVSVHVRRGDYVRNSATLRIHGTCTDEYYSRAIKCMKQRLVNPSFFLFSDEPAWAEKNLGSLVGFRVVDINAAGAGYNDMRLMSRCKHNILANSSFSWWSAWLNRNPEKLVIAPKQWFAIERITTDLVPIAWTRL